MVTPYRVVMLGGPGVGKTALVHQFMTSEHINAYDNSLDEEFGEQSVSIMLEGEESEIVFIDRPADEMTVEQYLSTYEPHAFVVTYSVIERRSFQRAEEVLQLLWRLDVMTNRGVILVANKTDIVRSRCVTPKEGSNLADSYDCKYIETSSGFNHQVDELLVGILKQIRLKTHSTEATTRKRSTRKKKYRGTKTSASLKVKSFLTKVCGKEPKSKSCENLHVL
ncbi:GTP-binding protein RAD-like [Penaeus chinensis]|uniref:GTP-binding protein RAD-like n=1 Tax=Penaeus chinensis TaxID=139456 RepID=UPI001FB605D1|nr:GTP-binding protein RAD-like [Penaeus chinensis]